MTVEMARPPPRPALLHNQRGVYPMLVVLLLCITPSPSPYATNLVVLGQTCPRAAPMAPRTDVEGHGALGPLVSSASSSREVILGHELPYARIRQEISKQLSPPCDLVGCAPWLLYDWLGWLVCQIQQK